MKFIGPDAAEGLGQVWGAIISTTGDWPHDAGFFRVCRCLKRAVNPSKMLKTYVVGSIFG